MGDLWYLALAYSVIWLGLFVYVFRLAGRAESLRRELNLLRQMLEADSPAAREGQDESVASAVTSRPAGFP